MNGDTSKTATLPDSSNTKEIPKERKVSSRLQIIKNLIVLCMGFMLLFTSYNGLSMLQSTMNQSQGIGVASQAIIYALFCISASLLPKYTIRKLGCKNALLVAMSCYFPYIAVNFYFNWLTMVPSAILIGLAASILWSSNATYLNASAENYSNLTIKDIYGKQNNSQLETSRRNCSVSGENNDVIPEKTLNFHSLDCKKLENINNYHKRKSETTALHSEKDSTGEKMKDLQKDSSNCLFPTKNMENSTHSNDCKCYNDQQVDIKNLESNLGEFQKDVNFQEERARIVSSITARIFGFFGLAYRSTDIWSNLMSYYILQSNSTLDNVTESGNCSCGASFCNEESTCFEHNLAEPSPQMRNILTGVSVLLVVLAIILVYFFLDEIATDKKPIKFSFNLLQATCKFSIQKEALLLIPLSSYIGFQQGFYIGDFTKSYIACAWGVYHVGLVTVAYGIAAGISCTLSGMLVKYVGRMSVILGGGLINAGINIYLLIWNPIPSQPDKFFIAAALWGIAIGILWSQLRAFYGVIFKEDVEVAFAGFYLWDAIGYCMSFSYSNYICTYIKIYILLAVSTIGIIGYVKTESIYKQRNKNCELKS